MPEPVLDPTKARKVPQPQHQIILYWPMEEIHIWETFKSAMKNEGGTSASQQIRHWIAEWYKAHAPGNPQTPLDRYEEPLPVLVHQHKYDRVRLIEGRYSQCCDCGEPRP